MAPRNEVIFLPFWRGFHVSSRLSHALIVSSALFRKNTTPSSTWPRKRVHWFRILFHLTIYLSASLDVVIPSSGCIPGSLCFRRATSFRRHSRTSCSATCTPMSGFTADVVHVLHNSCASASTLSSLSHFGVFIGVCGSVNPDICNMCVTFLRISGHPTDSPSCKASTALTALRRMVGRLWRRTAFANASTDFAKPVLAKYLSCFVFHSWARTLHEMSTLGLFCL